MHGAGRSGGDAWPAQATDDASLFCDHGSGLSMSDKAALVAGQAPRSPHALIAHSLGAVAAVLAMRDHDLAPTHLILVEPALYDIARGTAAIEAHVGPMTQARGKAAVGDLYGYWEMVKPMMFGAQATSAAWPEDQEFATRFASLDAPWGHGINADFVRSTPTLVLTGAWNDEYESIATVLARSGASRTVLEGSGHRVQDHPDFGATILKFLTSNSSEAVPDKVTLHPLPQAGEG